MPEKKVIPIKRRVARPVPVHLEYEDGQKLHFSLSFDFNTLARIEEKTGIKTMNIFNLWIQMTASVLGVAFWAAAVNNHPEYDSDEGLVAMRSYLDVANADRVGEALWQAYMLFLPKEKADALQKARDEALAAAEAGDENPPTPATTSSAPADATNGGSSSGPSPDTISPSAKASSAS